jgi:ADP-heptose:LPS heptosyltransferase
MVLFAPFAAKAPSLKGQPSPKDYPWAKELATLLEKHNVVQVGGNGDEQLTPDFRRNLSFSDLGKLILESKTAITVDSYLQHYYWFLKRRAIVLWGISDPVIFGHPENINLLKDRKFLRPQQFDLYYTNQYCTESFVTPERVVEALNGYS